MGILVLEFCALACFLVNQGSATVSPLGEGLPGIISNVNVSIDIAPTPVLPPIGTSVEPPLVMPPLESAPTPQTSEVPMSSPLPPAPSPPPPYLPVPPPPIPPPPSASPPTVLPSPVPIVSPPNEPVLAPVPMLINPNQTKPVGPVSSVPAAPGTPESLGPSHPVLPEKPPSLPPDVSVPPPAMTRKVSPPAKSLLPVEPPSNPPEPFGPPTLTPPPSISSQTAIAPLSAPTNKPGNNYAPVSHSPSKGPPASKPDVNYNKAPAPHPVSMSPPGSYSPKEHHSAPNYNITPAPFSHTIPPVSRKSAPPHHAKPDPEASLTHNAPPPKSAGSSEFPSPNISPSRSADSHYSPTEAPSPPSPSELAKIPMVSPKSSPSGSSPRHPKMQQPPPLLTLPPPPPQKACAPLTCTDPLTYGPPEYPCVCVLPIQVGLRLTVALYTFFPLVSELAAEIAAGVFMKQSQVRIMGANAAEDNPEKTIVLIDLVPLGRKFDDTTAYLTFQRFWQKQVLIKPSIFGDYDLLYVRYPGLPPSPPLPPSTVGVVTRNPYPGNANDPGPMKPIGVDARGEQHKDGPSGSIMATIVLSAFVAAILLCAIAWIFLLKNRDCAQQPDPTPASTIRSLAKSSGMAISMVGSGPSSPSFSLGSSMAAYTGSAKTFSSIDLEKATDNFNETRVLGEGGFGVVYSGVLEDGTEVAAKILKRYDQQGSREFLAEVEMLTRLHHRNLVKLIGICTEARTRCLVYELIPNGSVESHLHGIHKEAAPLDWSARLKIALGAARALAYLHEDSSPRVIHRDFKASNILLEDDFTPKVSDFGLARTALDEDNKHISTRVMGTFGYVAPEYAMTGHLLVKSDVYSYGVVLLELLTGKKPVDMSQPPGQENLVSWARPLLTSQEGLESILDPLLGPIFPFDSIAKVAAIASMCVQPEVSHRPFMGEVVQALKLVSNECDRMRELLSKNPEQEDHLSLDMEAARSSTNSDQLPDQSPVSNYDYRLDCERDFSMSELLSSSAQFDGLDSGSYRRYSSSGPIRTGRTKRLWKAVGRLSGGTVSEHRLLFRLWPGSH